MTWNNGALYQKFQDSIIDWNVLCAQTLNIEKNMLNLLFGIRNLHFCTIRGANCFWNHCLLFDKKIQFGTKNSTRLKFYCSSYHRLVVLFTAAVPRHEMVVYIEWAIPLSLFTQVYNHTIEAKPGLCWLLHASGDIALISIKKRNPKNKFEFELQVEKNFY